MSTSDMASLSRAFLFVDYHSLFEHLSARLPGSSTPESHILHLIGGIRRFLVNEMESECVQAVAYADFTGLSDNAYYIQRDLATHGVETRFVPLALHANVVDMRLCVDVLDTVHRRPDVSTIVLVTAERELLPLIQAIHANGRHCALFAFKSESSAELIKNSGLGRYVDARQLLETEEADELAAASEYPAGAFNAPSDLPYGIDRDALEIVERYFGQYEEIYLTPLLRKLSEELGEIEGHEPKSLIGDLEAAGAVRLEKRRGVRYDYTVLILNQDHPDVAQVREEVDGEIGRNEEDYGVDGREMGDGGDDGAWETDRWLNSNRLG